MKVKVKRKAKALWHPDWVESVKAGVKFAAEHLNISNKPVEIDVRLKYDTKVDYAGVCLDVQGLERFVVIINGCYVRDEQDVYRLVFHEMAHVAQGFHQGFLWDNFDEAHYEGLVYKFVDDSDFQDCYYHLPWEVDARKTEKELLESWNNLLTI